jgi:hypothetical protein
MFRVVMKRHKVQDSRHKGSRFKAQGSRLKGTRFKMQGQEHKGIRNTKHKIHGVAEAGNKMVGGILG